MYDDNENFRLDDDDDSSSSQSIVDIIDENTANDSSENDALFDTVDVTTELDINRKNREGYEQLMKDSSTQLDSYWDVKDPFIKAVLIGLLIVIVIGTIIIFGSYISK